MKKERLLKHIGTYHDNKSFLQKKLPGNQNTYPRVSRGIENVIEFLDLIPGDSISDADFKRLMVLIYLDKDLSPKTQQTFKAMSDGIDSHHKALASEAAAAVKEKELVTPTERPSAEIEYKSAASETAVTNQGDVQAESLRAALAKEFKDEAYQVDDTQSDEAQEEDDFNVNGQEEIEEEVADEELEENPDKLYEKEQLALNEYQLALAEQKPKELLEQTSVSTRLTHTLTSQDEPENAANKLLPPAPPSSTPNTSPGGPLKRSISTDAIHTMLVAENKSDVVTAGTEAVLPASGDHLIPQGSSATVSKSVLAAAADAEAKIHATATTPLLSGSPTAYYSGHSSRFLPPSYWTSFKRATAFGLTMTVMDFANTHGSDERLNYRAMRAVSIGFIYSVLSYNTENSSALTLVASLFHSALNIYFNQPATLYNAASSFFGRSALITGSQIVWNQVIAEEQEPTPTRARVHR